MVKGLERFSPMERTDCSRKEFSQINSGAKHPFPRNRKREEFKHKHSSYSSISFFSNVLNIVFNLCKVSLKKGLEGFPECPICFTPMFFMGVGQCDDVVCWLCVLKMRILGNDIACAFCKIQQNCVLLKEVSGNLTSQKQNFTKDDFKRKAKTQSEDNNADGKPYNAECKIQQYNLLFESKPLCDFINAFIHYTCWHPACTTFVYEGKYISFGDSMEQWTHHMITQHRINPCDICLNNRHVFVPEQLFYYEKDLRHHFYNGDKLSETFILPHIRCYACKTFCFDLDSYLQHAREHHISCYICDKEATLSDILYIPPSFRNFRLLDLHYQKYHYVCRLCDFLAFSSEAELNVHMLKIHQVKRLDLGHHDGAFHSSQEHKSALIPYYGQRTWKSGSKAQSGLVSTAHSTVSAKTNLFDFSNDRNQLSHDAQSTSANSIAKTEHQENPREQFSSHEDHFTEELSYMGSERVPPFALLEKCVYYNLQPNEAKLEELRRIFRILEDENFSPKLREFHLLVIGLRDFFAHDTNPSLRNPSTWKMRMNRSSFIQIFDMLWSKQMDFSSQGYGRRSMLEPAYWRKTWRILFPDISPGSELFLRLILSSDNSNILKTQVKHEILKELPLNWKLYLEKRFQTLPETQMISPMYKDRHAITKTSQSSNSHSSYQASNGIKEQSPENEAKQHVSCGEPALAIAQLNVSSTIPFIVALQEACKVFELHDLKEFNRNLAPSEDLAFKIKNSLKDASLKDLSLLSCLMKHSTSDELRRNVAEHILSLCAPYFLLAKHDPESRSRSRHWVMWCNILLEFLCFNSLRRLDLVGIALSCGFLYSKTS